MDVLSIGAWIVCLFSSKGDCEKPLNAWYTVNGLWACGSLAFLIFYSWYELKRGFQRKKSLMVTYGIECGYLLISIWAWIILA